MKYDFIVNDTSNLFSYIIDTKLPTFMSSLEQIGGHIPRNFFERYQEYNEIYPTINYILGDNVQETLYNIKRGDKYTKELHKIFMDIFDELFKFMEIDETVEEAALRECLEETGLHVALQGLCGVWSFHHREKQTSGVLIVYNAHIVGGQARAGSDSADVQFFALDEIAPSLLAFQTHRDALQKWRTQRDTDFVRAAQS